MSFWSAIGNFFKKGYWAPAFNVTSSLVNNVLNKNAASKQLKQQKELYEDAKDYNTPQNQMLRFKQAGLNPNLVYGQGTPGNVTSIPTVNRPTFDAPHIDDDMGIRFNQQPLQNRQIIANTELSEANAEFARHNAEYTREKAISQNINNATLAARNIAEIENTIARTGSETERRELYKLQQNSVRSLTDLNEQRSRLLKGTTDFKVETARQQTLQSQLDTVYKGIRNAIGNKDLSIKDLMKSKIASQTRLNELAAKYQQMSLPERHQIQIYVRDMMHEQLQNAKSEKERNRIRTSFEYINQLMGIFDKGANIVSKFY